MSLAAIIRDDLETVFFDQNGFAEPVIWRPAVGLNVITSGIFNETYEAVDPDTGAVISSTSPRVQLMESYLPDEFYTDEQARIELRSRTFKVVDVQHEGEGTVMAYLKELRGVA